MLTYITLLISYYPVVQASILLWEQRLFLHFTSSKICFKGGKDDYMNNLRNASNENGSVLTHVHICLIQKTLNTLCQPTTGLKWWTKQLWWRCWMSQCSDKLFWFSWCIQIPVVNYWPIISTTPGNKTKLVFTVLSR